MSTGADGHATATDLAASALLGALLWDPRRVRDVADWLEPSDFPHWAHRAIYQTVTGLIADGKRVDLMALPEVLARGDYHDMHVDRAGIGPLSAPALHSLLSMTPATPATVEPESQDGLVARSEHVRYARIVLEDSIRRQVQAAGTRINQSARQATSHDADTAAAKLAPVLDETLTRLRNLTERLSNASPIGSRLSTLFNPGTTNPTTASPASSGPDPETELGQTRPPLTRAGVQRAEYNLIGACLVSDDVRRLVQERLRPEDLLSSEAAATLEAIRGLSRRGEPIDFVLVAVEVERQAGTGEHGVGIPADKLANLAQKAHLASGYQALDTVARAALSHAGHQTQRELQDLARDRTQPAHALLRGADAAIGGVGATARRLGGRAATIAATTFNPPPDRLAPPPHRSEPTGPPALPGPAPARHPQRRR